MGFFTKDLEKYYRIEIGDKEWTFGRKFRVWTTEFGLHCVAVYRFGRWVRKLGQSNRIACLPFACIHALLEYLIRAIHHVQINSDIGPGFYIGHVGTIYIGAQKIGDNVSVTHNVTIGVGYSAGKEGSPVIGNNVWIGTGSVITGAITIGNNVTVSAGTMLSQDIGDGFFVAGNPGRALKKDIDNSFLFGMNR
jgi:serine O-acetyltransferase